MSSLNLPPSYEESMVDNLPIQKNSSHNFIYDINTQVLNIQILNAWENFRIKLGKNNMSVSQFYSASFVKRQFIFKYLDTSLGDEILIESLISDLGNLQNLNVQQNKTKTKTKITKRTKRTKTTVVIPKNGSCRCTIL